MNVQKRLAARLLKASKKRIRFNPEALEDIKESITKADLRGLIKDGAIVKLPKKGISRGRVRKGKKQGSGSRKGKKGARHPKKKDWMNKIRLQRELLKLLKDNKRLTTTNYRSLYRKSKGGYFRSKRHLKLYMQENNLLK